MGLLGTSRRRQEVHPPSDAGELGAVEVRDLSDRPVLLGSFWEDVPAVLVFLRHYG